MRTMSTTNETFAAFCAAFERGERPNPNDYIVLVSGPDRLALDAMIDHYLTYDAPTRPYEAATFAESQQTPLMQRIGQIATEPAAERDAEEGWATLLPALRQRAGLRRGELARQLAVQIGLQGHENLVDEAYHEMESGGLSAETVKEPVLVALSRLLDSTVETLRRAGQAMAGGTPPGATG